MLLLGADREPSRSPQRGAAVPVSAAARVASFAANAGLKKAATATRTKNAGRLGTSWDQALGKL